MTFTLPRLLWADNGNPVDGIPVVLVELEWNRFFLYARDRDGVWKTASEAMTAHDTSNAYGRRLPGWIADWQPVDTGLNRWLDAEYADLTGN